MSTSIPFPPILPTTYQWNRSPLNPNHYVRRALASESLWIQRLPPMHQLFVSGTLTFRAPLTTKPSGLLTLTKSARTAWRRLRHEYPVLAVSPGSGARETWLEYRVQDREEVSEWVDRTLRVEEVEQSEWNGLGGLRDRFRSWEAGGWGADLARLCLLTLGESTSKGMGDDGGSGNVAFVFNFDHILTDGIGARILAGRFFEYFAEAIHRTNEQRPEEELIMSINDTLEPDILESLQPWINFANDEQVVGGDEFEAAVRKQWEFLVNDCATNRHGFRVLPVSTNFDSVKQHEADFRPFSAEDTKALLRCVKHELGYEATVTHLGHAAMVLAVMCLEEHQQVSVSPGSGAIHSREFTTFFSPCWMNGRKFLSQDKLEGRAYVPICQALGQVAFPNIEAYSSVRSASNTERREKMIRAAKAAGDSYRKIHERKSILSESVPLMEKLGAEMLQNKDSPAVSTKADIAPPFFLSDGVTERYIAREYLNPSDPGSQPVFTLDNVRFAANAEGPNIIIRLASWRDVITISAEWRSDQYPGEFVTKFLDKIAELMLLITQTTE